MAERPLLIFPRTEIAPRIRERTGFGSPHYHRPSFTRHKDKLTPIFESMRESFIAESMEGLTLESVLIFETTERIEDFRRAAEAIEGLEWLAEIDEDIEPDDDYFAIPKVNKTFFSQQIDAVDRTLSSKIWNNLKTKDYLNEEGYITAKLQLEEPDFELELDEEFSAYNEDIKKSIEELTDDSKKKKISGRFFLSMSNRQAMDKLYSLWQAWDAPERRLPYGYAKWEEIFKCLKQVRKWDINDRIRETGIINYWQEELDLKRETDSKIKFEIELWYHRDQTKRSSVEELLKQRIADENGTVLSRCHFQEIRFHALKAELPADSIEKVLQAEYSQLFKSNDVMFFHPTGQCAVLAAEDGEEEAEDMPPVEIAGNPVVAIFDGLPFTHHSLLNGRLTLDDPDGIESLYEPNERKHGTTIASLICHGDLEVSDGPLSRTVYCRPIMQPDSTDFNSPRREHISGDAFCEDIVERSVRRLFESIGGEAPIAPSIKIINLSIGDPSRMFFNRLSSWARLLDWLSEKYQILFIVSSGNIVKDIDLIKSETELSLLDDKELLQHSLTIINNDLRNRRLLAPAESLNSITVGAMHNDSSEISYLGNRIDILPNNGGEGVPSPISALGHGFRSSIKPDLFMPGGKQLFYYVGSYGVKPSEATVFAPGLKAATTGGAAELNKVNFTRGTSNSAALTTRGAAQIFEMLNDLRSGAGSGLLNDENIAVLIKTLLIHSCSWGSGRETLEDCLKNSSNSRQFKKTISRYLGYGTPNINRVLDCTEQRATALGCGVIKKDEMHEYRLPLPPSLSNTTELRKLIITLAWISPINPDNRKYRKANLSFKPPKDEIGVERIEADWQQARSGTVQHEILMGTNIVDYRDGDFLTVPVVCKEDAGTLDEDIRYALAVTLEVEENISIPIYEEIRTRIGIEVPVVEVV